jgi:hypothetical protein
MGLQLTLGIYALELAAIYSIVPLSTALFYGLRRGTVYVYHLVYPPEKKVTDPSYQVITKKDLSKLDEETRKKLIETYGDDIMIISNKNNVDVKTEE